ncbi:hypothetical protein ACFQZC_17980 [Streptacidiphilus monticola]
MTSGHGHQETVALAEQQVRQWLKALHYDAPSGGNGRDLVGPQAVLDHVVRGRAVQGRLARWRLREFTVQGIWQTSLTVSTGKRDGKTWVQLDSEQLPVRGETPAKALSRRWPVACWTCWRRSRGRSPRRPACTRCPR